MSILMTLVLLLRNKSARIYFLISLAMPNPCSRRTYLLYFFFFLIQQTVNRKHSRNFKYMYNYGSVAKAPLFLCPGPHRFNPIELKKAYIVYNFGLSECSRVNRHIISP